jgi:glycosyltransferase involved in cell wall biosynthesis
VISIHMAAHRRRSGQLATAVESVLSQTFADFELVICDDASPDGTATYLAGVAAADTRVRILRNERGERSEARSFARCFQSADATRPFVTWMFEDTRLEPAAVERLIEAWADQPESRVIFGVTVIPGATGDDRVVGDRPVAVIREEIDRHPGLVPDAGIMVHREVFAQVGWYDASIVLRRACEWDLFRRIFRSDVPICAVADRVAERRADAGADPDRTFPRTDFELMKKYADCRDRVGWPVDLRAALYHPIDRIPEGEWTDQELQRCRRLFVEYYEAVGRMDEARRWGDIGDPVTAHA